MISSTEVLVAGDSGTVYYSSNGGTSWINRSNNSNKNLNNVFYLNPYMIYVVGDNGLLLWTGNKGTSWVTLNTNCVVDLSCISFYNLDQGIAVGKNGTIVSNSSNLSNKSNAPFNLMNQNHSQLIPNKFNLEQNYPNPFNPSTEIKYSIPVNTFVTLNVYDMLGQNAASLVNEFKNAGNYSVTINRTNLSSGIYFYTIEAGSFKDSKKMVLIK